MICVCKYGKEGQIKPLQNITKQDVYNECYKMQYQLLEYKKIEDELGIDLITLFKALKNGIWVIFCKGWEPEKETSIELNIIEKSLSHHWSFLDMNGYDSGTTNYYFKDYGKTWALTREELL